MKVDLNRAELWALIGCVDGVYADERDPALTSAYDKISTAYSKELKNDQ